MNKVSLPKRVRKHVNPLASQENIDFRGFSQPLPMILDVGAYRGEFTHKLFDYHGEDYNYIVTEIRKPYLHYLEKSFAHNSHVAVFGGDTARNIPGLLKKSIDQGAELAYVFINFPDPWFKERHKKRRVLSTQFLDDVARYASTSTVIIFQTDQKKLFRETQELLEERTDWQYEEFDTPLWGIQSYWELQKIKEGAAIYRMQVTLQKDCNKG